MNIEQLYPSRWLKAVDLAKPVLATISHVDFEEIGDNERKPCLHFVGDTKPMILNRTNCATIATMFGSDTEDWNGRQVVLFSAKVQFQSKLVDAIRIREPRNLPQPAPKPVEPKAVVTEEDEF